MVGPRYFLSGFTKKFYLQNEKKTRRRKLIKWASKNTLHVGIHLQVSNVLTSFFFFSFDLFFLCYVLASFFFFFPWFFFSLLLTNVLDFFPLIFSGCVAFFFFLGAHLFIFSLILIGFCFCSFLFFLRKQFWVNFLCYKKKKKKNFNEVSIYTQFFKV